MKRILCFVVFVSSLATAQTPWSTFLDATRAIDWASAGFTIPSYTVACTTAVSLTASSPAAASANATSIQNALNSCDATHNVVNIPSGTYYFTSVSYGTQGKQVLRGAGPSSTEIIPTTGVGCAGGASAGLCMIDASHLYNGATQVLPGGSNACTWSAGYSQGTTSISLTSCGSAPPLNQTIILDQANDSTDNSGNFICDVNIANCGYESNTGGNNNGRLISGKDHSQQQVTKVTGVTSLGGGAYTVTISPGVYFTNIVTGNAPGAWWPGFVANDGVENLTIDGSAVNSNIDFYDCYQCWVKNVRSLNADRNHVAVYQSMSDVVRDSYFYASQGSGSQSYAVEFDESSAGLIENNIFQQVTLPVIFNAGTGSVIDYNFNTDVFFGTVFGNGAYASHHAGNEMNLFEGNSFFGTWVDDAWGTSDQGTFFRNMLQAWQNGKSSSTFPIMIRSKNRNWNIVGNVMGQPGYHNQYQTVATSTSGGTGASLENTSIYTLGWGGTGAVCSSGFVTTCDPLSVSTLMRWANYDTVTAGTKFDTTEASPAANTFVAANFSSSYFSTLAHTLPASLYYASKPSWFSSAKAWPPIGPDVSTGNVGVCTGGTMAGAQATTSGQCPSGTLTAAWAAHTVSIPAQDCFLNVMGGPADGTGSVLAFDATACAAVSVATPTASPVAGTYVSAQTITLSTTTGGATICYTIDGTTPTANGAGTCTGSTLTYSSPFLLIPGTPTVKAIGSLSGDSDSGQLTAAYTITPQTWHLRTNDGGTAVQCTGKANAAYTGSGSAQACAFNNIMYMWTNNTSAAAAAWRSAPYDIVQYDTQAEDVIGIANGGGTVNWLYCAANSEACVMPLMPSGTKIWGVNKGNCSDPFASANRIKGTGSSASDGGLFEMLDVQGTTDAGIECIGIYQADNCSTTAGNAGACVKGTSNYVQHGIRIAYLLNPGPTRLTLKDMFIVGMSGQGILGSHFGPGPNLIQNVHLAANAFAGWDWDSNGCGTSCKSTGDVRFTQSSIDYSGCSNSTIPFTTLASILPDHCAGQSNGGYGDALGVGVAIGSIGLTVDHSSFQYNVQDAIDTLHSNDGGADHGTVLANNNYTAGNGGQMLKFGGTDSNTAYDNILGGACASLSLTGQAPMSTWPSSYKTNLSNGDLCRASDQVVLALKNGSTTTFIHNTVLGQNTTAFDIGCAGGITVCTVGTTIVFQDNLTVAYANPLNGGTFAAGIFENGLSSGGNSDPFANAGSAIDHNLWFNPHNGCPQSTLETNSICGTTLSPLLLDQGVYTFDAHLTSPSPARAAGVSTSITNDYSGNLFASPPSMGAMEFIGATSVSRVRSGNTVRH